MGFFAYAIVIHNENNQIGVLTTYPTAKYDYNKVQRQLRQWFDTVYPTEKLSIMKLMKPFKTEYGYILEPL